MLNAYHCLAAGLHGPGAASDLFVKLEDRREKVDFCKFSQQSRLNKVYSAVNIPYGSSDETDAPTVDYGDFVAQFCSGLTARGEAVY